MNSPESPSGSALTALRAALYAEHRHCAAINTVAAADASAVAGLAKLGGRLTKAPFASAVKDFYLTNPIARASAVLAECSALARGELKQAAE